MISKQAPEEFKAQLEELRAEGRVMGDFTELKLVVGNRHESVKAKQNRAYNSHRWTMFVKFADKKISANHFIEKVRFGLHPSFGADYMDIKANPDGKFEFGCTGWGTFNVPVTIHFRRECGMPPEQRKMELDHNLSFEGAGKWRTIPILIKKTAAKKMGIKTGAKK